MATTHLSFDERRQRVLDIVAGPIAGKVQTTRTAGRL
jgi:hypothetical protein